MLITELLQYLEARNTLALATLLKFKVKIYRTTYFRFLRLCCHLQVNTCYSNFSRALMINPFDSTEKKFIQSVTLLKKHKSTVYLINSTTTFL